MSKNLSFNFDVIVIGGGHAGIEAAHAAACIGSKTVLITLTKDKIGLMPCNPAIGGVGKGHIVFEISALGGMMPKLCTKTYLQARMLNTKKGPAVQGLRLQIDKFAYNKLSVQLLDNLENLTIYEGIADDILLDIRGTVEGIRTLDGTIITAPAVIITTGTFLNGRVHIGKTNFSAGRRDEQAVDGLSKFLSRNQLLMGRLKTGTPPRLLKSSVDFSKMEYQEPDNLKQLFEFYPHEVKNTRACYITHTNERTHKIIRDNLHLSAMYSGNIVGRGPRYCPSIEDKVSRFADKTSHHVFVEPEGADSDELYPNGISTSLPADVQLQYIQTIPGFEQAVITKNGYAIEYDFVYPNQLSHDLQVKKIPGLFLAGQINGTTGYEEAAGQGIVAGINAHRYATKQEPFILDRTESYIGVMIDDLVTMSIDEPYRMFTSRAERRLVLRQDNSFLRLTEKGYKIGLVSDQLYQDFIQEKDIVNETLTALKAGHSHAELLKLFGESECSNVQIKEHTGKTVSELATQTIHAQIRYEPYLEREQKEIAKAQQYKTLMIPETFSYLQIPGLSKELQEKLERHRPLSIAQAALIPGMTPAAISLLIFKIRDLK